ncbi:Methyltransferase domain-containing protein [Rickettsiales endosymbiont of Paramecium tredecaurelia]|uniref:methyltransferase domain-containing protein n=1 Tax=Candidatus Sarmatiella mevalonica TaxID=2770581 RepID=UPI0019236692|nr:class I SAM-dependent methyltransferase [Candidatus Sarmatiella mevalonica]MBL3284953.1 Methyltransferase domain-containing protein [Candidatus Sarmatiella mevalonica]
MSEKNKEKMIGGHNQHNVETKNGVAKGVSGYASEETSLAHDYDEQVYAAAIFGITSPALLQSIATLFGMKPKPAEKCKVLELGCSTGENILFFASLFPESHFVGIDISAESIRIANQNKAKMSLKNVEFLTKSITDVDQGFGKFDYIIAHGIFSWVPENVRDAIVRVFKENLEEQGVAYVSYNALPGWSIVGALRDVMMYHTRNIVNPDEKVDQALAVLSLIKGSVTGTAMEKTPYAQALDAEIKILEGKPRHYFRHDHLSTVNQPFHFHQVLEICEKQNLQYLAETDLAQMYLQNMPKAAVDALQSVQDVRQLMQYLYFIRGTRFASNLFTHASCVLNRTLDWNKISDMYFYTEYMPVPDSPGMPIQQDRIRDQSDMKLRGNSGAEFSINHPIAKAALCYLNTDLFRPMSLNELVQGVKGLLASEHMDILNPIERQIPDVILQMLCGGSLKCTSYTFTRKPWDNTKNPKLTPFNRHMIDTRAIYASPVAVMYLMQDIDRVIALLCDGSRSVDAIVEELHKLYKDGVVQHEGDSGKPKSDTEVRQDIAGRVSTCLNTLYAAQCLEQV